MTVRLHNTMRACLPIAVMIFPTLAFAVSNDPAEQPATAVATISSIEGENLAGQVDLDALNREIEAIANNGDVVFRGDLMTWVDQSMKRGIRPRPTRVSGAVDIPQRELSAKFTYDSEHHLTLHTGKWTVVVIGNPPKP